MVKTDRRWCSGLGPSYEIGDPPKICGKVNRESLQFAATDGRRFCSTTSLLRSVMYSYVML